MTDIQAALGASQLQRLDEFVPAGTKQARTGSTRLPGKVLMDLSGEPMLARVVSRLARARSLDAVWIATTTNPADDALAALCADRGWPFVRGQRAGCAGPLPYDGARGRR
jgi:GTP:adenosylcobinamide-phosphate guanylyltransferase